MKLSLRGMSLRPRFFISQIVEAAQIRMSASQIVAMP